MASVRSRPFISIHQARLMNKTFNQLSWTIKINEIGPPIDAPPYPIPHRARGGDDAGTQASSALGVMTMGKLGGPGPLACRQQGVGVGRLTGEARLPCSEWAGCLRQGTGWGCAERQSLESEAAIEGGARAVLEVGPGAGQGAGQGLGPDVGPEELEGSEQHFKADPSAAREGGAECGRPGARPTGPGYSGERPGHRALGRRQGLQQGLGALEGTVGPAQLRCAETPVEAVSCHSWGWGWRVLVGTCC